MARSIGGDPSSITVLDEAVAAGESPAEARAAAPQAEFPVLQPVKPR